MHEIDGVRHDRYTAYEYDAGDRLTRVTDPKGDGTTYVYDDLGNLLSQSSPDTGMTTYTYDAADNLTQVTDAKGQVFVHGYDILDRQTGIDAPGIADDVTLGYDTCANGVRQLCRVTIGAETVDYAYDTWGQVVAHQGVGYGYDGSARVSTVTYPSGNVATYYYDIAGRLTQVDLASGNSAQTTILASNIAYAPFGPMTGLTYGNGLTLSRTVDRAYRITSLQIPGVLDWSADCDSNGNLTEKSDFLAVPAVDNLFDYDALDQLISATGPFGARDHEYDRNGNRTKITTDGVPTSSTLEAGSNRMTGLGTDTVTVDANGNVTAIGTRGFVHNAHNRLIEALDGTTSLATYAHNGLGQRMRKTDASSGVTLEFVYDTEGRLLGEYLTDGTMICEYVYLDDTPLAQVNGPGPAAGILYLHTDLGTLRRATNANGTVVWAWESDPFGSTAANKDPDGDGTDVTVPLRFPGHYFDEETGLHYNYFRTYDPSTGRYIESDPIGLEGGLNTYLYADANPVRFIDPEGLSTLILPRSIIIPRPVPMPTQPVDPVLPIPDIDPFPGGSPKDPFGEYCRSLARKIANTRDEIYNKRYPDLTNNPGGLPHRIGPGEKLRDTVRGHEKSLNRRLRELRDLENEYSENCVPMACSGTPPNG